MNYSLIIDYVRIVNVVLAPICMLGVFFSPEAPLMQPVSPGKLLNFAVGGMYIWATYVTVEALLIRAGEFDDNVHPDLGPRAYLLLFWLSLTLVALIQRHKLAVEERGEHHGL